MGQWAIFISFIHGPKINMNIPPSFPTSGKLRINPWKSALFWIFWVVLLTKPYQGPVNWTWGPSTQAQDEHPRGAHAAHCGGSLRGPEDGLRTAEGKAEDLQLEADRHQETGWKPLKGKYTEIYLGDGGYFFWIWIGNTNSGRTTTRYSWWDRHQEGQSKVNGL